MENFTEEQLAEIETRLINAINQATKYSFEIGTKFGVYFYDGCWRIDSDNSCCPIGAICVYETAKPNVEEAYSSPVVQASELLNVSKDFVWNFIYGFDDGYPRSKNNSQAYHLGIKIRKYSNNLSNTPVDSH